MSFGNDDLGRAKFADLLISLSAGLAKATVLPAGRVIAVDAPWGSGKSWIAQKLNNYFKDDARIGKCVYVDAFEFDFHEDPFTVVTSAILAGYNKDTPIIKSFKKAAIDIMKVTLPAAGKGFAKAGINYIGFDEKIIDDIKNAGEVASEKAISKMLDTFTNTNETTKAFKAKLEALVKSNQNQEPLVVVIDELDRCRPSFALEMLERVKHLFDVPNVVFIFFIHTPALHSAIRKTYGNDINPAEYLRKFIALTIGLPNSEKSNPSNLDIENFTRKFLTAGYPIANTKILEDNKFRDTLAVFSPIFRVTFRDIENVMLLWEVLNLNSRDSYFFAAYFLLIKIKDSNQFIELKNKNIKAYEFEIARLGDPNDREHSYITYIRDMFLFGAEPEIFKNVSSSNFKKLKSDKSEQHNISDLFNAHRILAALELEYLRL